MDLGLRGRNAVVLGGTRGIGRAIAGTLAGEGAGVAVCARNADQVMNAVAELQTLGARATGAPVDITEGAALKSWIANVAREFGGIDMLFSNAGAMAQGGDPASWEQNFRLDVLGAVNAFEAARPFLEASGEKNGDAAFVIISSISAAQADTASSYGPVKRRWYTWRRDLRVSTPARKSARTSCLQALSILKVASGTWSSRTCPSDTKRRSRVIQPAAWPRRRRLRTRQCSWRAQLPRLRLVQI